MRACRWIGIAVALVGAAAGARGQEPPSGEPEVEIRFPARPGVCGTGDGVLIRNPDGSTSWHTGHGAWTRFEGDPPDPPCRTGDVVVRLERTGDRWSRVRLAVGRRPLGVGARPLPGDVAAAFLLDRVPEARDGVVPTLILAASLAGAETWPRLLELARDRSLRPAARKAAVHGLGREAAGEAVAGLGGIVGDPTEEDEVREAAVFALSRLPRDRSVPLLIDLARTSPDARVRSRAFFWLADLDDPRALALFEEVLQGGGGT
jgi:hypothetical protein